MKIIIKIKDVSVEIEDDDTNQAIRFYLENIKTVINEVFENYKKLDL